MSKKPTTSSTPRKGRKSEPTQDESFRRWLEQQLHKKYDAVLEEPVPDELLSLLRPEDPQK